MHSTSFPARVLGEPLLHFVVIGALLFAVDHVVASRKNDPHLIVIGSEVDNEAKAIFREAKGRDPSAGEMKTLRTRWLDNEVLYREGLALRVDQGDSTIRERVIFKTLNVVQANLAAPKIDEKGLRDWFESNRAKYGAPARLDFQEAVLAGDITDEALNSLVSALNRDVQGEAKGGLRVFKSRPRNTVVDSFGLEFTTALEQLPIGKWQALPSKEGVRVVQLNALKAAEPAEFAALRGEVLQDWKDERLIELRTQAVRDVGKKYTVQYAEVKP